MLNLNSIIVPKVMSCSTDDICTRGKLDIGTRCNYNCYFCYYKNNLKAPERLFNDIINDIDILSQYVDEIDLSGGEPTIHSKWFAILDICSRKFKRVSTLTNGSKFKDFAFIERSKKFGLQEVLFSLHGWDAESHDKIVGKKGAFDNIIKAIYNSRELGLEIRVNCTVGRDFDELSYKFLIDTLPITQLNFLIMNYWDDASSLPPISYDIPSNRIKYLIDELKDKMEINVRYAPFCKFIGYEKYVVGTYQHIFDKKDWNIVSYNPNTLHKPITKKMMFDQAKYNREHSYIKPIQCKNCDYRIICDGIEEANLSCNALISIETGNVIEDVMYFRNTDECE